MGLRRHAMEVSFSLCDTLPTCINRSHQKWYLKKLKIFRVEQFTAPPLISLGEVFVDFSIYCVPLQVLAVNQGFDPLLDKKWGGLEAAT
jgi:hypothetical protein